MNQVRLGVLEMYGLLMGKLAVMFKSVLGLKILIYN